MATSKRRVSLRLLWGVNRKSTAIRWIGQETVRVSTSRVHNRGGAYSKADKGFEKTCTNVRRKRGLRRGKSRSRGGKPPLIGALRPSIPKGNSRLVNHSGRKLIWLVKTRNKLDLFMRKVPSRPVEGDLRYSDGYARFRALSWRASKMGVPWGAFEHPGGNFTKYLNSLWPTEQVWSDFSSMLRHVKEQQSETTPASGTEPGGPARKVIIDGEEDYLCSHCQGIPAYKGKPGKAVPFRRVCNMNDPDCHLAKVVLLEKGGGSLRRSNAKRGKSRR